MIRFIRVHARLALRWFVRFLTGRRWTVLLPDPRRIMDARVAEFVRALTPAFYARRRDGNRDLLTGMLVALTSGHSQYMTGWERYKYAATRHSNYRRDIPARLVGRPVVYKNGLDKLGMTEFHQDYIPRAEQLAPRRARAAARQSLNKRAGQ